MSECPIYSSRPTEPDSRTEKSDLVSGVNAAWVFVYRRLETNVVNALDDQIQCAKPNGAIVTDCRNFDTLLYISR